MEQAVDRSQSENLEDSDIPLISVVLPVYNVALYIKEAIDSILNQTIQDFEIIVVDDCSTDATIEVIQSFNDDRIKIITKIENKGLIDSLNIGFEAANGKYIARMDGDDINKSDRFEKQLYILENNLHIKACGCWLQEFGSSNKLISHSENHEEILARLLLSCSLSLGCAMLDRKWAVKVRFDENKKHVEDYDFWSRVAWTGNFYNLQEVLYYYRVHVNQVSTIYNSTQKEGDIMIKLFLLKKLNYEEKKYPDQLISRMMHLTQHITVDEFVLFIEFLDKLYFLNKKSVVYSQIELMKVIRIIKKKTIRTLFFKPTTIGIDQKWRLRALLRLPARCILYVLKLKIKERKRTLVKWLNPKK